MKREKWRLDRSLLFWHRVPTTKHEVLGPGNATGSYLESWYRIPGTTRGPYAYRVCSEPWGLHLFPLIFFLSLIGPSDNPTNNSFAQQYCKDENPQRLMYRRPPAYLHHSCIRERSGACCGILSKEDKIWRFNNV